MVRIAIVAPGRRLTEATARDLQELAAQSGLNIEVIIHPQAFMTFGHFAGPDEARLQAFLDVANDPGIDAVWFARGGYGAGRLLQGLQGRLTEVALNKVYLGYSDAGFLMAALTCLGCRFCAHGPLVGDIDRVGGQETILRALRFLSRTDATGLAENIEPTIANFAFNLTIIRSLLGTPWLPTTPKTTLWIEDVGEYDYVTDRSMFQLASSSWFKTHVAGVRVGRFSAVPENDVPFPFSPDDLIAQWCGQADVPILGPADIGHDSDNKIVPFGLLTDWRAAGLIPT